MQKILYFYLQNCPHCHRADEMIRQLTVENPAYAEIQIEKIEESQQKELADSYDYYYVPCFYINGHKMMEGVPSREKVQKSLDAALL